MAMSANTLANNTAWGGGGGAIFLYSAPPKLLNVSCLPGSNELVATGMLATACPTLWTGNAAQYGPVIATTAQSLALDTPALLQSYSSNTPMDVTMRVLDFYQQTISSECRTVPVCGLTLAHVTM